MRVRNPWALWNARRKDSASMLREPSGPRVADGAPNATLHRPAVAVQAGREGIRPQQRARMTTPVLDPHPAPMEMFERHGAGHEKEGQRVMRQRKCDCGEKFFQARISEAWLDRMPPHQSKTFVEFAAEIDGKTVWLPRACPKCERRALNNPTPPQKELV
jgi:hypothetical protein